MEARYLLYLSVHGITKTEHLSQLSGIIASDIPRINFLFTVGDPSLPEILNTNAYLVYKLTFLQCLCDYVHRIDTAGAFFFKKQSGRDNLEKELLELF
jgi:hypothetical protein